LLGETILNAGMTKNGDPPRLLPDRRMGARAAHPKRR